MADNVIRALVRARPALLALALCLAALGGPPAAASASTVNVPVSADADTSLLFPTLPHGHAATISTSVLGSAYVEFGVPPLSNSLLRATLQLNVVGSTPLALGALSTTVSVQQTQNGWSENSLTYLNAPQGEGSALATAPAPSAPATLPLDVTPAVGSGKQVSFVLSSASPTATSFGAREGGDGASLALILASSQQDELTSLLSHPGQGGAAYYAMHDDAGNALGALAVTQAPDPSVCEAAGITALPASSPCYLGVYQIPTTNNNFLSALAVSRNLAGWHYVRNLESTSSSQPTIAILPDGSVLVAVEQAELGSAGDPTASHIRVLHWSSVPALLSTSQGPDVTFDAPRQLSSSFEGTPDVAEVSWTGTLAGSTIQFGMHWFDGNVDHQGQATLSGLGGAAPSWSEQSNSALDAAVRATGVQGNVGDRSHVTFAGVPLVVVEGQQTAGDFGSWSLYVDDPSVPVAERIPIVTPRGSQSFGNPSVAIVTLPDGHQGLVVSTFVFSENNGPGEAGELLYWLDLP
jgi:hypothetical protein